jgi:hypothetical protein
MEQIETSQAPLADLGTLEKKKAVDRCVAIMKSEAYVFNLASIYEALPAEFREKVKPIGDFDAEYARKWQERKFTRSQMRASRTIMKWSSAISRESCWHGPISTC